MNLYNRVLWSELKMPNVTVRVSPKPRQPAHVFRILTISEINGRRIATLGDIDCPLDYVQLGYRNELSMPAEIGNMSLLYTRGVGPLVTDVENAIGSYLEFYFDVNRPQIEKIVPDVLQPHDFLVFRKIGRENTKHVIQTYRAVSGCAKTIKNRSQKTGI